MNRKKGLKAFVSHYRETADTDLSDGYVEQLHVAVRLLYRYHGGKVRLKDLDDDLVNGFVRWLTQQGRKPDTVRGRRNAILCLWRAAFQQCILKKQPQRILKIRSNRRLPVAWSRDEVIQLRNTALQDKRRLRRIDIERGLWFGSLISAAWDSALRLGDLLRLDHATVKASSPFRVRQSKTGDDVLVLLTDATMALIDQCMQQGPERDLIWPLWGNRDAFYYQFRQLVKRAEIRPGTFRFLRRSAVTDVEVNGGDGSLLAGHRSRVVTERHYIDAGQLEVRRPRGLNGMPVREIPGDQHGQ